MPKYTGIYARSLLAVKRIEAIADNEDQAHEIIMRNGNSLDNDALELIHDASYAQDIVEVKS